MGPVQPFALEIGDANRFVRRVEQDARHQDVGADLQPVGMTRLHVQQPLACADADAVLGRHRREPDADRVVRRDAPVVGVGFAVAERADRGSATRALLCAVSTMVDRRSRSRSAARGTSAFGVQPAVEAVTARVLSEPRLHPVARAIRTVLQLLEVRPHVFRPPAAVAGQVGQLVPVGVVRTEEDHRVVRGTTSECTGARIQHAIDVLSIPRFPVVRIALLLGRVAVVAHEEVPAHRRVFSGEGMERRHVVVVRIGAIRIAARGSRIRAGFEHEHAIPGFGKTGGHGAAAGAGADDDVFRIEVGARDSGFGARHEGDSNQRDRAPRRRGDAEKRPMDTGLPDRSKPERTFSAPCLRASAARSLPSTVTSTSGTQSAPACRRR